MQILGATDVGNRRQNNEDSYRFGVGPQYGWAVVCDGVGGANGGEIASKIVAESIEKSLKSSIRSGIPTKTIVDIIEVGISRSYILLLDEAKENEKLSDMATTVAGVVISDDEIVVYWAGDSRVYLLRGDKLIQLTKDHTVVAQMVESGAITAEEAENHPKRNYITNCVDAKASATVEYLFNNLEAIFCF